MKFTRISQATVSAGTALLLGTAAHAQTPPEAANPASSDDGMSEVVVTGSRLVANGYQAPTPVTVVTTNELLTKAPESIVAGLQTLPQFKMTSGPNVTSAQARATNSGNYLNLRGLGENETLLLLNGQRLPPTSYAGTTDANIIPQALIQRVDVVTGGASAAYGSDAVAGVVNFILDTKFEGVKASAQAGISSRGDDRQKKFGLAFGKTFMGDRLHLEGSLDYFYQPGIPNNGERPYGGNYEGGWVEVGSTPGAGAAGTQSNPFTPVFNVRIANGTYGTLVSSGRNAAGATVPFTLNRYTFDPDGGYHLADLGTPTGTPNYNVGGADTAVTFGTTLTSFLETKQAFLRADLDFTDNTSGFLQASFTDAQTQFVTVAAGTQLGSFQIFSDNAFLPTSFSDQMIAEGVNSFVGSRVEADQTPKRAWDDNEATTILAGVAGELGKFKWNVTGSYGDSDLKVRHAGNFNQSHWFAALDAVRGPQGNIVCRITITNPGLQDDCVPWNLFGNGSPSKASYAYFEEESTFHVQSTQSDVAANVTGALFELPAGPVNLAVGAEYRHQYLDMASNNDPSQPISLTGLRTNSGPYNLKYNSTNQGKAHGTEDITEGYVEISVPVLRDKPFFKSLDLNGAARYTDYSVSGEVWAWKGGLSWSPLEQLRIRGTLSQDIRAPTLNELFAGVSSTRGGFADVHTNVNTNTITLSQGNPDLKPEIARTLTVGAIWQPEYVPGFSASVDYYRINIADQISALSNIDLNQRCEDSNGTDPVCAFINRPFPFEDRSPENFPTSISTLPFNQASAVLRGFDYELNYRLPLESWMKGTGHLDLRFIGNKTSSYVTKSKPTATPIQLAGVASAVPSERFTASAQLTGGPLSFGLDVRYIGPMYYTKVPTQYYTNNRLPSIAYLGANVSYELKLAGRPVTLYTIGSNLTDKFAFAPQPNAQPTEFYPSFQSQYDVVGRYYVAGFRTTF